MSKSSTTTCTTVAITCQRGVQYDKVIDALGSLAEAGIYVEVQSDRWTDNGHNRDSVHNALSSLLVSLYARGRRAA